VWGIVSSEGKPVVVIAGPVQKKARGARECAHAPPLCSYTLAGLQFAVDLLWKGAPLAKPRVKLSVDTKSPVLAQGLQALQERLLDLAVESIPTQSTNAFWKNKPNNVIENFPKIIREGNDFSKPDGTSGKHDPSITLSFKVPSDKELTADTEDGRVLRASIASYEPPAPEKVAKSFSDTVEAYTAQLRRVPPTTWGVKIVQVDRSKRDASGNPSEMKVMPNTILVEKRTLSGSVMFELSSVMMMPVKTISIQMRLRQMMVTESGGSSRTVDDDILATLWKTPGAAPVEDEY